MRRPICTQCGRPQESDLDWKCGSCGGTFQISPAEPFKTQEIRAGDSTLWRYEKALSLPSFEEAVTLGEGQTPLTNLINPNLYVKSEFVSPTGSFKDRGSTTMLTVLRKTSEDTGRKKIVDDSSGNAGASIAAYSTRAGLQCEIYAPEKASESKLRQIIAYGAKVKRVAGPRENLEAKAQAGAKGNIYASHVWNPYFIVGQRTLAYEISEQLAWNPPDYVFIPTSAGSLLLGIHSGFDHLVDSDVLSSVPKLVAVQSEEMSPLYHAFQGIAYTPPQTTEFLADALISVKPVRLGEMVKALKSVKGGCEQVSRAEIISSMQELARSGFYVEPSSAVAHAGWKKWAAKNLVGAQDKVVLVLTGSGLKAPQAVWSHLR